MQAGTGPHLLSPAGHRQKKADHAFDFAYGADYPLIEPDYDEELDDEEFGGTEEHS